MLPEPIKQRVRESFDRAASTYDDAAVVQRRVCARLVEILPAELSLRRILDAGCGTGDGARRLRERWPQAHITGVDFAPAMLARAQHAYARCVVADIEKLPFPEASFDLWWSSLSLQWCAATAVFAEAGRVLPAGGLLAASTLGPETFHELRSAFAQIDSHRHTLPFSSPEAIGAALAAAGFGGVRLWRERHTLFYPDLKSLLRAIKAIGAQNVGEGGRSGMLGRQSWQRLEAAYEAFRQPAGLPASYDVVFVLGERGSGRAADGNSPLFLLLTPL